MQSDRQPSNAPPLLTEAQAAEFLNVHPRTVKKARGDGQIQFVRIGRCIRYRAEDIAHFIRTKTVANDPVAILQPKSRPNRAASGVEKIVLFSELARR